MPADLNRTTLVGRLTRDPELRHTAGGTPICSIRLAVNSRGKDEQGEWTDKPNFFDVAIWGRQGETAAQHLAKGRRVGIDGSLSWREWTDGDGNKRQTVEIDSNDIYFLDSKPENEGSSPQAADDIEF